MLRRTRKRSDEIYLTLVAGLSAAIVMAAGVGAQAQQCPPLPTDPGPHQTILLALNNSNCVVQPYVPDIIPRVHGRINTPVMWGVCNRCGAEVDVRLWNGHPQSLYTIFQESEPDIDASGNWTARVGTGFHRIVFKGTASAPTNPKPPQTYQIAVKFADGDDWNSADPELQIDATLAPPPPSLAPSPTMPVIVIALVALTLAYWLVRRRRVKT